MSRSLYKTLSEIKEELIEEVHEMLNIFETMEQKVNGKSPTEILLQNEIDRLLEVSLTSEIRDCVLLLVEQQKHELLKVELEKSANDSRDIQANLLKRIKILENNFQRAQAQSIAFELKLKHQKEKMDCDVSWKTKLSPLHDENVLLKHQHQNEINEMFEDVTQKTYAYADVRAQNQDLLMTIYELTSVGSSNSVRRPKSKDNKSKNNVLKNTKSSSTYVLKTTNNVSIDSNKCETKPSNVCQTNACITSSKTINVVNDGLNIVCISCGLDVFLHSHEKCVAHNALTRKSSVKRALFTSPVAAKSKSLGATSVVAKSRFSVAKTPTTTNKIVDSGCSKHMCDTRKLSRGSPVGIHGLFSGWCCGLADKRVTLRVSVSWAKGRALSLDKLAMPPHLHKKFRMEVAIATGCRGYYKPGTRAWVKWGSCKIRIPIDMRVYERLTIKFVKGEEVLKIEITVTAKDGTITKFLGKFLEYKPTNKEEEISKLKAICENVIFDISGSDSDLESTTRSGPRDSEMEDTRGSGIQINA
ncbi:hypothetical protein Tco_0511299 [Tanacetum coccineum]